MGAMIRVMSNNKNTKETLITTNEGIPGAVEVTPEERERIRIPVYQILI